MPGKLVVLLSGGGTTLQNIFDRIDRGELDAEVVLVVSSKDGVKGLERASSRGVPTAVVSSKKYRKDKKTDWASFSKDLNLVVLGAKPNLVILAGFMCFYEIPPCLDNKVMNIHPALIPAFAGQGMYGDKVHKALVKRGAKVAGCTVHFVTNEYDAGPIIVQRVCKVLADDTADDVAAKVFVEECEAYPSAISMFLEGRLSVQDGIVHVAPRAPPVVDFKSNSALLAVLAGVLAAALFNRSASL